MIGALAYPDTIGYSTTVMVNMSNVAADHTGYDIAANGPCNGLYSFCDLMAN
ncbi:MAG: hypothetical protein MJ219_01820 [Mycoplasmoidaceae bacterium]|nr:hypothetical protein [Mycoplasmoidaceae bacterium]